MLSSAVTSRRNTTVHWSIPIKGGNKQSHTHTRKSPTEIVRIRKECMSHAQFQTNWTHISDICKYSHFPLSVGKQSGGLRHISGSPSTRRTLYQSDQQFLSVLMNLYQSDWHLPPVQASLSPSLVSGCSSGSPSLTISVLQCLTARRWGCRSQGLVVMQQLPAAPVTTETQNICSQCLELTASLILHHYSVNI